MNDVSSCYKLKLFLQQFHIPCAVLNSELPLNNRVHIIEVSDISTMLSMPIKQRFLLFTTASE